MSVAQFANVFEQASRGEWANSGPVWRIVPRPGMFWQCICHNARCEASGEIVVCTPPAVSTARTSLNVDHDYAWDLTTSAHSGEDGRALVCPMCRTSVRPASLGFSNCQFSISGTRYGAGEDGELCSKWIDVGDESVSWSPSETGVLIWRQLGVKVRLYPRPDPKPGARSPAPTTSFQDDDVCAICLHALQAHKQVLLLCQHAFHSKCVASWAAHQARKHRPANCPICRRRF